MEASAARPLLDSWRIRMPKITEMFAFVAEESPGEEGVMAALAPGTDTWMPLIGADVTRVASLLPIAEAISQVSGRPYRCLRFELVGEFPITSG